MKTTIIIAAAFLAVVALFSYKNANIFQKPSKNDIKIINFGQISLNVEIADSAEKRIGGLSGRGSLNEGGGMLFIFEKESEHGIWMKEMKFAIDIAWLDADKKIVHIEHGVNPDTYPEVFGKNHQSEYVLETEAGFFEKNGIKIGDFAEF